MNNDATDAAFSSAVLVTLVGSITPALIIFSYFSVAALNPKSSLPSLTFQELLNLQVLHFQQFVLMVLQELSNNFNSGCLIKIFTC